MDEIDDRLLQLALVAQQAPPRTRQRQRTLVQLINALKQSRQLVRPRQGQFQGLYEDIYADALQRLFIHICERIEDYRPERGKVLQWVNFLLSRRFFIQACREITPTVPRGMDLTGVKLLTMEDLDRNIKCQLHWRVATTILAD